MVYVLAATAALVSATAGVLQRLGVESAPADATMRLGLLGHALRRGVWLLGFALLLGQFALQATALRFGDLTQVQPLLTLDLLFLVGILAAFFHQRPGRSEWVGAGAIVGGLVAFLVVARPRVSVHQPSTTAWLVVTGAAVAVAVLLVIVARRGPRWWRAAALGTAAAALFAYNASTTKSTTEIITHGWGHVLTAWQVYAIAVTGGVGFFLLQAALHAGPIAASRAASVTVNPLASIVVGVAAFGDRIRAAPVDLAGEALALIVLCAGAVALARSPMVSGAVDEVLASGLRSKSAGRAGERAGTGHPVAGAAGVAEVAAVVGGVPPQPATEQ